MRTSAQVLCAIVGIAILACETMEYIGGRQGMPLSIAGHPATLMPGLVILLCLASLFVMLIVALVKRRDRCVTLLMTGSALFLFAISVAVVSDFFFQAGFRARLLSSVTPEELRQIAVAAQQTLPESGRLPAPGKNLWSAAEHQALWDSLTNKCPVAKLDSKMVISKTQEAVSLIWGGAPVGHWGVIIETGPEQSDGDIAKGIGTVVSSQ